MGFFLQTQNAVVEERGIYARSNRETYFEAEVGLCSTKTELSICDDKNAKKI